jgi:UrcA family protein
MSFIKTLLPIAALALSGLATAGTRDTNNVVVRYGDLNLNSQAGVRSLHKRIRNAAESVCSQLETRILGLREAYDACVDQAVAEGVAAVGNPNLTAVVASNHR